MRAIAFLLVFGFLAGCTTDGPDGPELPPEPLPSGVQVFGAGDRPAVLGEARAFETGFSGGEPNMGVTSSGAVFASAGSAIIRSTDGGESWEEVHRHQLMNSDPMMWVDPWTDCIYNVPMSVILLGATIYESCDDGDTWTTIKGQNMGRGVYDHQKFASALPGPDAPPVAGLAHPTVFIVCYNALVTTNCAISYDGGINWPHDVPMWDAATSDGPECAGQQSHPTGSPDGVIVVAKAWGCDDPWVFVSTDSGLTWEQRPGPQGIGADTLDPEIAFSDDGAMYMLWQSERGEDLAYLARSDDLGQTWAGPWNVTPPGQGSSIFAALHAGGPGRVAMAFHAMEDVAYPSEAPDGDDPALWHTYIVTSEDANGDDPTFVSHLVDENPVQVGGICNGNQGCHDGNRNLLDFIDGAVGPNGTFYAVIADGCTGSCDASSEPADSRDRAVVMTKLEGWSLFDA